MPETKKGVEEEQILKPIKSQGEETSGNMETTATSKSKDSGDKGKKEAEDVFDFKVDEFTTEPVSSDYIDYLLGDVTNGTDGLDMDTSFDELDDSSDWFMD